MGKAITTVGVTMLAIGLVLPFLVGPAIPPLGYNILQLGGIGVAVVGVVIGKSAKKSDS